MHQLGSVGELEKDGDVLLAEPHQFEIKFFGTTVCADGIAGIVEAITVVVIIAICT